MNIHALAAETVAKVHASAGDSRINQEAVVANLIREAITNAFKLGGELQVRETNECICPKCGIRHGGGLPKEGEPEF